MAIFLLKKMGDIRKMPTEKDMLDMLVSGNLSLPPLAFRLKQIDPAIGENRRSEALVEVSWKNAKADFIVECKSKWTPRVFENTLNMIKMYANQTGYLPMIIMPFLSEFQLEELDREEISGVDLCGNGIVIAPGRFFVHRSGNKNQFRYSEYIQNIYRKNTSMVSRVFFTRSEYNAVQKICDEVNKRNILVTRWKTRPMSLSTVSKALKTLDEDLIVDRNNTIRLLQPEKLLEKLSENYKPKTTLKRIRIKLSEEKDTTQVLNEISKKTGLPFVATGTSSVTKYAVMQRSDMLSVYCPRIFALQELNIISRNQSDRFPNLEIIESDDETLYFDAKEEQNFLWASPVQVYLELMAGDKRDQETAEQVKSFILNNLKRVK